MKKPFVSIQSRICSLSCLGCNQIPKFNYPTYSKIYGDLQTILDHPGGIPIVVLEDGYCGLKQFGCFNPTIKNSKT